MRRSLIAGLGRPFTHAELRTAVSMASLKDRLKTLKAQAGLVVQSCLYDLVESKPAYRGTHRIIDPASGLYRWESLVKKAVEKRGAVDVILVAVVHKNGPLNQPPAVISYAAGTSRVSAAGGEESFREVRPILITFLFDQL